MLAAAIPFMLLTASGIFMSFFPAAQLPSLLGGTLGANILSVGGLSAAGPKDYENAITIASLAFAGAFLYCLRLFFKSLLAFDLSSMTFFRAFLHMLFAILLAAVLWRAAPEPQPLAPLITQVQTAAAMDRKAAAPQNPAITDEASTGKTGGVPKIWLLLAFAAGFLPDVTVSWMARKARLTFNRTAAKLASRTAPTPLTMIDGIDFLTACRLDERRVGSVQNLAAANPIMMHAETAVCIVTIMDWIAQAQLCTAVGPQRFLFLRKLNLRTIFDLERAVLDPSSPAGLKQMAGAALLASDGRTSILRDFGLRPVDVSYRDFDKTITAWVSVEVIEHLVRVMMDSLHVHRLRQIWHMLEAGMNTPQPGQEADPRLSPASQTAVCASAGGDGHSTSGLPRAEVPVGLRVMS